MNGATTDPCARISNPPKTTRIKIIGAVQFFLTCKNIHNSRSISINSYRAKIDFKRFNMGSSQINSFNEIFLKLT